MREHAEGDYSESCGQEEEPSAVIEKERKGGAGGGR